MGDQVSDVPTPMTDGEIRATFLTLAQAMTSQAIFVTSQVQAITSQVNREIGTRVPQHDNTIALRLRDFARLSSPIFLGSKSEEDPKDLLNDVYKILYSMGVTSVKKAELAGYQLKDVDLTW